MGLENNCYLLTEVDGQVKREDVPSFICQHEEADTRMVSHMLKILDTLPTAYISIRSNDTDVIILLMYHVAHAQGRPKVWMDAGLSSTNSRRYISISQLVDDNSSSIIDALPGFHAFTGSDVAAAFINKVKLKPFEITKKSDTHTEVFSMLEAYML